MVVLNHSAVFLEQAGVAKALISVLRPIDEWRELSEIAQRHLVVARGFVTPLFGGSHDLCQTLLEVDDAVSLGKEKGGGGGREMDGVGVYKRKKRGKIERRESSERKRNRKKKRKIKK